MYGGVPGQRTLGIVVVLIVCGVVIGLALIGSDLINPITSWAESQRYQAETQRLDEQGAVDVAQYEKLLEAQTQVEVQRLFEASLQEERIHQAEIQRLNDERQQEKRLHQEEIRQTQEWAELKLRLVEVSGLILVSGFAMSLIVLSVGVSKRLWRNSPPSPRWVQASLRPQQPMPEAWQAASRGNNHGAPDAHN